MKRPKNGPIRVHRPKKAKLPCLAHARGHGRIPDDRRVREGKDAGAIAVIKRVQHQIVLLRQLLPRFLHLRLEGPLEQAEG